MYKIGQKVWFASYLNKVYLCEITQISISKEKTWYYAREIECEMGGTVSGDKNDFFSTKEKALKAAKKKAEEYSRQEILKIQNNIKSNKEFQETMKKKLKELINNN